MLKSTHSILSTQFNNRFSIRPFGRKLIYWADLLSELVLRDVKVRYKHSVLGIFWSLLNPLCQLLVFTFVFGTVLPMKIEHYPLYVYCGLLVYSWFQSSVFDAAGAITRNRELLLRPRFPVAILPLVAVLTNLIHFVLALPIYILFLWWNGLFLHATFLALPLLLLLQLIFTLGLAYIVAGVNTFFRDTQYLVGIGLQLLFFLTPIFYQAVAIPERVRTIYQLNPMVTLVQAYRALLLYGIDANWGALLHLLAFSAILLVLGYHYFNSCRHRFVEEL